MENNKPEKLSYEQLAQICGQQQQQIKKLAEQLREQNYQNVMSRLGVLFEVVKSKQFNDTEFQRECMQEIEGLIRIKEEEAEKDGVQG